MSAYPSKKEWREIPFNLSADYRIKMWREAVRHKGRPIAVQSGHFFAAIDAGILFETFGRRARAKIEFAIRIYHSNDMERTMRFETPACMGAYTDQAHGKIGY